MTSTQQSYLHPQPLIILHVQQDRKELFNLQIIFYDAQLGGQKKYAIFMPGPER